MKIPLEEIKIGSIYEFKNYVSDKNLHSTGIIYDITKGGLIIYKILKVINTSHASMFRDKEWACYYHCMKEISLIKDSKLAKVLYGVNNETK